MSKHCRTAFLSLALLGLAGSAVAQKAEIPKITPTKTVKSKTELPTPPVLEQNAGVMVAPRLQLKEQLATGTFQHNYAGGDLATYWISPLLTNHDSRMSGNLYTVDGNTVHQRFGFTVVNSSLEPLDVTLSCINEAGDAVPKYSAVLKLKPYGSAAWNTNQIEPSRTTDQVTADADRVWCGLTANRPFAAFGTMTRSSGTSSTSSIALIAAAR